MRIGISGMFWNEPMVGSGQYVHHMVQQLPRVAPDHEYLLFIPAYTGATIPHIPDVAVDRVPTPFDHIHPKLAKLWYEQIELPRAAARLAVDVLHVPYYGPPRRQLVPVVTTVHDVIPLMLPAYRGSLFMQAYTALATSGVKRSAEIIAVSDHTRDDVVDVLKISAQRVHTVYEGFADEYKPQSTTDIDQTLQRFNIDSPYLYYIGGFDVRKNLPMLLRAFGRVRRRSNQPLKLVIGGKRPPTSSAFFPALEPIILDEGLAGDVIFVGRVSNAENAALYAGSTAFVWPSSYEGFGLPPLEAMACGAVVISSNTSSMPEIIGDGGVLLAAHDTEAWARSILDVVQQPSHYAARRQRAIQRAHTFQWQRFAREVVAIYERIPARYPHY